MSVRAGARSTTVRVTATGSSATTPTMTIPRPPAARPPVRARLATGSGLAAALALATRSPALGGVGSASGALHAPPRPESPIRSRPCSRTPRSATGRPSIRASPPAPSRRGGESRDRPRHRDRGRDAEHRAHPRRARTVSPTQTWYLVRLPILPNNSTGWVPRSARDGNTGRDPSPRAPGDRDRRAQAAREGIFMTRVGVGRPCCRRPRGSSTSATSSPTCATPSTAPSRSGPVHAPPC
jgi:hypothetical protein